jgi:hypothetical protein
MLRCLLSFRLFHWGFLTLDDWGLDAKHVHWSKEDQALREYDRAMIATGIYEGRQVPTPGKPGQVEDYGWMEHSARRVSQPTRTFLRQVLSQQGFELE